MNRLITWLLERVADDPVRFPLVLMFLALLFTIYLLAHRREGASMRLNTRCPNARRLPHLRSRKHRMVSRDRTRHDSERARKAFRATSNH